MSIVNKRKVTLKDIAKEAGVGLGTASRVLNQNPSVKESSRKAVFEAMKKLNYKPNAIARSLKTKTTRTIGVMIPDISSPFYPEVVRGIEDISNIYKYNIILCNTDKNQERVNDSIDVFWEKKVDGIILISSFISEEVAESLKDLEVPVVLILTKDPKGYFASVTIDNEKAAFEAVNYLCELGHKRIAFILGKTDGSPSWTRRLEGYKLALKNNGILYNDDLVIRTGTRYGAGYHSMKALLEKNPSPTAIFAGTDIMAMGAAKACNEAGLKIPDDISIIGFDGIEHTEYYYPSITTVKVQRYDMGAIGMRMLTKLLNNEELSEKNFITEVELVKRSSCKEVRI
jgi:LacI family transcriptional regulator